MSRSHLFRGLRRIAQTAFFAEQANVSSKEAIELISRRDLLRRTGAAAAAGACMSQSIATPVAHAQSKKTNLSVGIVGGGLAGLLAARTLRRSGLEKRPLAIELARQGCLLPHRESPWPQPAS
ncbi:MAG: twin-arginine translocation signal domain-containing protein, partial [Pirellula sp.]